MTEATEPIVNPPRSGKDIRAFRLIRGVSLDDMALEMKISKPTLMKAEAEQHIWLKSRKAIADYFNGLEEFADTEITVLTIWPELMETKAA